MAFPTSGLTNNLVHKEGNRAFVYDSALGVWDQVRETDRTENKIQSGTIGSGVTFPAGHIIQTVYGKMEGEGSIASGATNTFASWSTPFKYGITPLVTGSKILVMMVIHVGFNQGTMHFRLYRDSTFITDAAPSSVGSGQLATSSAVRVDGTNYVVNIVEASVDYLDSPTIPAEPVEIFYELKSTLGADYNATIYYNRSYEGTNTTYNSQPISSITLMEVAG